MTEPDLQPVAEPSEQPTYYTITYNDAGDLIVEKVNEEEEDTFIETVFPNERIAYVVLATRLFRKYEKYHKKAADAYQQYLKALDKVNE